MLKLNNFVLLNTCATQSCMYHVSHSQFLSTIVVLNHIRKHVRPHTSVVVYPGVTQLQGEGSIQGLDRALDA